MYKANYETAVKLTDTTIITLILQLYTIKYDIIMRTIIIRTTARAQLEKKIGPDGA
jgi:hypothetical protein